MNKPFYTDYVRHALRFYTRNLSLYPPFKKRADMENWLACDGVVKDYEMAKKYSINQNIIWDMMKEFERKIAIKRNLI